MPNVTIKFNNYLKNVWEYFTRARDVFNEIYTDPSVKTVSKLHFFLETVKSHAPLDIKRTEFSMQKLGSKFVLYDNRIFNFDDFGNYSFGLAARAFGIPLEIAKMGAGLYQVYDGWSERKYDLSNLNGYFDYKRDTYMIENGYNFKFLNLYQGK